jgi:hypothetical protein
MTLDGKPVRAGLSTIRPHGYMGMRDAGDLFGIDAASPGMTVSPVPAEDSKEVNYRYPFKTLSLGGVTVNNPTIDIRPQTRNQVCKAVPHFGTAECYGGSQVNLGLSELTALRLYFAFDEKVLYATAADAHR